MENPEKKVRIGIRAEQFNKWERRASLVPKHVRMLLLQHEDLEIYVESSSKRCFSDKKYEAAGAIIVKDLSHCQLILGVKQVPMERLIPDKSYMFFSHTIKAQAENLPMLDEILEKRIRLIDYEKICDESGTRKVAFGRFAGTCGAIDILSGYGIYLLNLGISTPFLNITQSFHYFNLQNAKESISRIGKLFEYEGFPKEVCPLIFGVTSRGRCAQGVTEILELMPTQVIEPEDLEGIMATKDDPAHRNVIYLVTFEQRHMVEHVKGKPFSRDEYYSKPSDYKGVFAKKYLPHISVLFHAMYWDNRFPTIITGAEIQDLARQKQLRLRAVVDITCDYAGSIDFMTKISTIEEPYFVYKPIEREIQDDWKDCTEGILYCSIENLPTQFPEDASAHFSECLYKYLYQTASADPKIKVEDAKLPFPIYHACITNNGSHTEKYRYIPELRNRKASWKERVPDQVETESSRDLISNVKSMQRTSSFTSFTVKGHLFDTKAINDIVDNIVDDHHLLVQMSNWDVGEGYAFTTSVMINVSSKSNNMEDVFAALGDVQKICKEKNVVFTGA